LLLLCNRIAFALQSLSDHFPITSKSLSDRIFNHFAFAVTGVEFYAHEKDTHTMEKENVK
jgi:hypothetical protein